ncbi:MAG: endonuclease MutS2, partial [Clostridia bacterium]|nr:endonuclease MutS2 [Clostridia bacterium]
MIKSKTLKTLEYDKILAEIAKLTVLNETKHLLLNYYPETDFFAVKLLLQKTEEAKILLYNYGVKSIEYFDEIVDEFERAKKASVLSMKELLNIAKLLRSSRIASTSILDLNLDETINLNAIANRIFYDFNLENSIFSKIVNDTTIADNASEKLFEIRKTIRIINEKIREKLSIYIKSGANKYLQDNIISVRSGRYVVPVKSEHVKSVKGFIHDRSITGNTFFIEPQEILELNNELKTATLNESAEIERILTDLTKSVSIIVDKLEENLVYLCDLDLNFAKAEKAYTIKAIKPKLNANGYISIINGRHPLINKDKVVPISLTFGKDYNYILISGPNTGGKTVTLKLVGLFTLLTLSGIFIPASEGTEISVFQDVFVDVGDEQSIEQNLSTFSSHLKNIIEIVENVSGNSLVLIDELGAGTDP